MVTEDFIVKGLEKSVNEFEKPPDDKKSDDGGD
jgi:hypothetical protein